MPTHHSSVEIIDVEEEHVGRRIDNFLFTILKDIPKTLIYRLMRKGAIRVNKKRIKPSYRLQVGDALRIPPLQRTTKAIDSVQFNQKSLDKLSRRILYEDEDLLILNKPVGLAVHAGSGIRYGIIEMLRALRSDAHFLELAHRLDRETSGCLMIAKKRSVLEELHTLLRERKAEKIYYTVTMGQWAEKVNRIEMPLRKNVLQSGERMVVAAEDGKPAVTEFHALKTFEQTSFVKVMLHTGRTHQIRVHAQFAGHPIAGDDKYGNREFNKLMRRKGLCRLFLHAGQLSFKLPSAKQTIVIKAPLDKELVYLLHILGKACVDPM